MKVATFLRIVACLLLAVGAAARAAEMKALVVAVSEYPRLEASYQLEGPRNDAIRLRDLLARRGFTPASIVTLADGVPGANGLPTRARIMSELADLARGAQPGDYVLLYFAGHGSQQPADRSTPEGRDETDGLHEIFLPRDVGAWTGSAKGRAVENAIVNYELRAAVDRITAKGAFVWGVFDACHSATLVRGETEPGVRFRYVPPAALGIDAPTMNAAGAARTRGEPRAETPLREAAAGASRNRSVFFYATQTRELAPEMPLPRGHPDRKSYGLFGFTVMQALESGVPMTYRQLGQYVLTQYGAMNQIGVTPLYSGTALDMPVLMQKAPVVQQWKLQRGAELTLQAGALNRVSEGALLAVLPSATAKTDEAIGYLRATRVALTTATVTPVAHAGKPALAPDRLPDGAFARLVEPGAQYQLRVYADAATPQTAASAVVQQAVERLRREGVPGAQVQWAAARDAADLTLRIDGERLLLLPPAAVAAPGGLKADVGSLEISAPNARADEAAADLAVRLGTALHAVARATNLMRIATQLAAPSRAASALEVRLALVSSGGKPRPMTAEQVPAMRPGDKVRVGLRNKGSVALDVTMLYLDARFGVGVLYPAPGASNRLEPGAEVRDFDVDINDATTGIERMMVVAVEAAGLEERADFSFLAQPPLAQAAAREAARTRGAESDALQAFRDAGFAEFTTRGGSVAPKTPAARTSTQVFTLRVGK